MKPNIILITIDALRADRLGFMSHKKDISPNIDKLAKESSVFTQAFSVGPITPHSFPAILTSTYSLDYQGPRRIERPRVLISEVLKNEGYITAAFHSNPYLSGFFGYNQGWDFFEYISTPFDSLPDRAGIKKIKFFFKEFFKKLFRNLTANFFPELLFKIMYRKYKLKDSKKKPEVKASFLNQTIKDFVSSLEKEEKPFFIWVHYMDVHSPYFPQEKYQRDEPLSYPEFISAWLAGYLGYSKRECFKKFIKPYFQKSLEFYDQGINYTDKELGELFDFLKAKNFYENTIICLTADHGEEFLEHGEGFHNTKLYNELLHVPFLIKVPGKGNQIINRKVSLLDLAPTLCSLAGIKPAPSFKGKNLFEKKDEVIFHQTGFGLNKKMNAWIEIEDPKESKLACQSNQWKYILDYSDGKEELYDLLEDPKEQNNLIKSKPEILFQMRKNIQKFVKENPPFSLLA